jgi:hypothetical protein
MGLGSKDRVNNFLEILYIFHYYRTRFQHDMKGVAVELAFTIAKRI